MSVDATSGGANSDSYIGNIDADDYWTAHNDSTWSDASSDERDAALREATQYLDGKYSWIGIIETLTQSLNWPREEAYDKEGRELLDVPVKVEEACAELALLALSGRLLVPSTERGGKSTRKEKVGTIEVEYFKETGNTTKTYSYVDLLLTGLTANTVNSVYLIRA